MVRLGYGSAGVLSLLGYLSEQFEHVAVKTTTVRILDSLQTLYKCIREFFIVMVGEEKEKRSNGRKW